MTGDDDSGPNLGVEIARGDAPAGTTCATLGRAGDEITMPVDAGACWLVRWDVPDRSSLDELLFKRQAGATETVSLAEVENLLAKGLDSLDEDVISTFASLLSVGENLPLLLRVAPRLVHPVQPGEYFAEEQVATWGVEPFWGLPEYPSTPYYRTFETSIDADAHLFEFIVPMVPPSWNDTARVEQHRERLQSSQRPTAVAVATLDVCAPAVELGADYFTHWGLTHFLLDGHHKLQAAAESGSALQLLSLVSVDASLASIEQIARIPELRNRTRTGRPVLRKP